MRVLGDDVFVFREVELRAGDAYPLRSRAHEPHLDTAFFLVIDGEVTKAIEIEVRAELPVQPCEHIQVEVRSDTRFVVVGRPQPRRVFAQDPRRSEERRRAEPRTP